MYLETERLSNIRLGKACGKEVITAAGGKSTFYGIQIQNMEV